AAKGIGQHPSHQALARRGHTHHDNSQVNSPPHGLAKLTSTDNDVNGPLAGRAIVPILGIRFSSETAMPLDRLVLILVIVIAAAAATVWLAAVVAASTMMPIGIFALIPGLLVAYVVWRVVADRLGSDDDDHYDKME
ncbi:hypothetical protein, partial [Jannaschia helgolandensis]